MAPTGVYGMYSPSGLSRMDDEQAVAYARAGSARAVEHLLRKYRRFVEGKARSYFLAGGEPDDVIQEGMVGLYKAIRDYRPDRLMQFRSFAEMCITRQIVTAVKSASRNKHVPLNDYLSLHSHCGNDEDASLVIDVLADPNFADPERVLFESRTIQRVRQHVRDGLSGLEREVFEGYLEGKTYQEMSVRLRRPSKTVDNALQRAKRKIGRRLLEPN
jgi:RNA polymerase sporulation-specific sigma factor